MPAVAVVCDSTSYLPRDLVSARGIHEVSLYVSDGAGQRRELDIRDYGRFYEDLRSAAELPTTSQPSIGDFAAAYAPLAQAGHDVVSVHISGGISGTVQTARQAAAELARAQQNRRVEVIDPHARAPAATSTRSPRRPAPRSGRCGSGSRSTRSSTCAAAGASAQRRRGSAAR